MCLCCLPSAPCLPARLPACLCPHPPIHPSIHPLPPVPSAERLLRHLHASGIPFCLATSSHLAHYSLKTTLHTDLFALFDHRVTGGCCALWGG